MNSQIENFHKSVKLLPNKSLEKTNGWFTYSKVSLKTAIIDFVENFYCNVEKVIMKQSMGITVHHFLQTFFYILIKNNKCHH